MMENFLNSWLLRAQKLPIWLLALPLMTLTLPHYYISTHIHHHVIFSTTYNYYVMTSNYFNNGFVRRGLLGTIATTIGAMNSVDDLLLLHGLLVIWLSFPVVVLMTRVRPIDRIFWIFYSIFLLVSPQLFWAWSGDVGRADMLTCGCIAWALIFTIDRRYYLAALVLLFGSLAHETTVIFGVPLCLTFGYLAWLRRREDGRMALGAIAVLGLSLAATAVAHNLWGAGPKTIAQTIIAGDTANYARVWSAYIITSGFRGIVTSACQSFYEPTQTIFVLATCVAMFLLSAYILMYTSRRAWLVVAIVAFLPMAITSIVAIDYGRWLSLAVFAAWISGIALRIEGLEPAEIRPRDYALRALCLGLVVALGPNEIASASWVTGRLADRLWPNLKASQAAIIDHCDPGWRSVVGAAQAAPRRLAP